MADTHVEVGDCVEVLRGLPDGIFDACVCDPPYDLPGGFMSLAWDRRGVAFDPSTWREVFDVLKPGAHLLAFGGARTHHRMACAVEDAGFDLRDCLMWLYGQGMPKGKNLKPAWEPIVLARKPGRGGLQIEGCRVPLNGEKPPTGSGKGNKRSKFSQVATSAGNGGNTTPETGRWPANVLLDEEAARMLDEQSGITRGDSRAGTDKVGRRPGGFFNTGSDSGDGVPCARVYADSGGASRFFYVAKASRSEREAGLAAEHPTVKPLALMRWLVRLVTPPGGIVLDPFAGSGTTLLAAREEGFDAVGIEREENYAEIARRRLAG